MAQPQADALVLLAEAALHHGIDPGAAGSGAGESGGAWSIRRAMSLDVAAPESFTHLVEPASIRNPEHMDGPLGGSSGRRLKGLKLSDFSGPGALHDVQRSQSS